MGQNSVISDVGHSLANLISSNMNNVGDLKFGKVIPGLPSGTPSNSNTDIYIHLYRIDRNLARENENYEPQPLLRKPYSQELSLYYLIFSFNDLTRAEMVYSDQKALGRVMQILNDNDEIRGSRLTEGLAGKDDIVSITFNPLSLDDLSKIWTSIQVTAGRTLVSYRLSALLEPLKEYGSEIRVIDMEMRYTQDSTKSIEEKNNQ